MFENSPRAHGPHARIISYSGDDRKGKITFDGQFFFNPGSFRQACILAGKTDIAFFCVSAFRGEDMVGLAIVFVASLRQDVFHVAAYVRVA